MPLFLCASPKKAPVAAQVGPDREETENSQNNKTAIKGIKIRNLNLSAAGRRESSLLKRNNPLSFRSLAPRQAAGFVLTGGFMRVPIRLPVFPVAEPGLHPAIGRTPSKAGRGFRPAPYDASVSCSFTPKAFPPLLFCPRYGRRQHTRSSRSPRPGPILGGFQSSRPRSRAGG
jgi:hypothetical protein